MILHHQKGLHGKESGSQLIDLVNEALGSSKSLGPYHTVHSEGSRGALDESPDTRRMVGDLSSPE